MTKDDLLKQLYDIFAKIVRDKKALQSFEIFRSRNIHKKEKDLEKELLLAKQLFGKELND